MQAISTKLNIYNIEAFVFKVILWSFGALVLFYVLFLGNMVKNIVERQGLEVKSRALTNEIRDLEVTYLSLSGGLDLDFSYSLGFKDAKVTFATRKALGLLPSTPATIANNDL